MAVGHPGIKRSREAIIGGITDYPLLLLFALLDGRKDFTEEQWNR
jgi:hypothetical protein